MVKLFIDIEICLLFSAHQIMKLRPPPPPNRIQIWQESQEFNWQMWLDFDAKAQTLNGHRSLRSRSDED